MESVVDFLLRLAPQPSCPRCGEAAQLVKTPEACHQHDLLGRALIATARELFPAFAPRHALVKTVCSPCGVVACAQCAPWVTPRPPAAPRALPARAA